MAIIELTTSARVKVVLGIDASDTTEDTWIASAIQSVSQRIQLYIDRPIETTSRTEEYDVHSGRQSTIFLRAYPVTSITSIKNSQLWDFASATAMTEDDDFHVDEENGAVHFAVELAEGPKALQVVYTGGLAADTAAVIANHPVLAQAADLQVAAMFRRRSTPQGQSISGKEGGSITFEAPLMLAREVSDSLFPYRRYRFGV